MKHDFIEKNAALMGILIALAVSVGGIAEIVPLMLSRTAVEPLEGMTPYTAVELEGRDIYIREGCVGCHSQMIRPFRDETERYGEYSKSGEFVYDRPFLWGSKRTGPDIHRVGGKYPDSWHYNHMLDPRTMSPGSIMPPYPWLIDDELDVSMTPDKINAMRTLGVPYPEGYENQALADLNAQAQEIVDDLSTAEIEVAPNREIVALIAYLQRLGRDIETTEEVATNQ